eukprot:3519644-Pyramimonas_sp.AAC.2
MATVLVRVRLRSPHPVFASRTRSSMRSSPPVEDLLDTGLEARHFGRRRVQPAQAPRGGVGGGGAGVLGALPLRPRRRRLRACLRR